MKSKHETNWAEWCAWSIAAALTAPCLAAAAWQVVAQQASITDWSSLKPNVSLLFNSLVWGVGIGVLTACFAWPAAWVVARRAARPWIWTPLIVPSYLVYHSLGLIRDPTTWLGGMIERSAASPPDGPGWYFLPGLVGRVLAFVGLALWAWPIAAAILGSALRAAEADLTDNLRMDGAGPLRRQWAFAVRVRGAIARAVAVVALVMLGSSVPLHLSNAPTVAVSAWQEVVLHPGSPAVWLMSWPLIVIAGAGAWTLSGAVLRADLDVPSHSVATHASVWTTRVLVAASTVLPLVLYAVFLRTWKSIPAFLRVSGDATISSAGTAALVGLLGVAVCAAFWWACATGRGVSTSRSLRAALCVLVFATLVPGILVGHAWAAFWTWIGAPDGLLDSLLPTVLAHATRFAGVAALVGCVMAGMEPRATRDARAIDAGASFKAWMRTGLSWGLLAGVGVGVACLSLHEVESSIVVQPPGLLSLPQTMLANLHFARQEETSAGAIVVIGAGLVVAWGAGWIRR